MWLSILYSDELNGYLGTRLTETSAPAHKPPWQLFALAGLMCGVRCPGKLQCVHDIQTCRSINSVLSKAHSVLSERLMYLVSLHRVSRIQ